MLFPFFFYTGDAGSPLYAESERGEIVLGIAGKTVPCFNEYGQLERNPHSIYVRVSESIPWILETILSKTRCHCLDKLYEMWSPFLT